MYKQIPIYIIKEKEKAKEERPWLRIPSPTIYEEKEPDKPEQKNEKDRGVIIIEMF